MFSVMVQPASQSEGRFGASFRLRRGKDFERIFEGARSRVGTTMVLRALPSVCQNSRCGVIASKRTLRRAVDRNRAKRLLREAFRLGRTELPLACDIILIARAGILRCKIETVRRDFEKLVATLPRCATDEESS